MKKRVFALCMGLLLSAVSSSALAVEEDRLITTVDYYTATLYYCDSARHKVVLKNVKPTGVATTERRKTMQQAEYNEIWISGSARLTNGTYIPLEELNHYVDREVGVVITRNRAEVIRVVALHFR